MALFLQFGDAGLQDIQLCAQVGDGLGERVETRTV